MTSHPVSKGGSSSRTLIIVALIGCSGTILAACIAAIFGSRLIQCWFQPYTCNPPSPTVMPFLTLTTSLTPAISISSNARDMGGNPIDMNSAPFQIAVTGTVSNADGLYIYLIVADKNHHYVQPGLGSNVNNDFNNICQLGDQRKPDESYGQLYTIYAVVTDKPYTEFAWFEGESYIAKSKELKITREPMPTPTTLP